MRFPILFALLVAAPIPALAQSRDVVPQGITVSGSATIRTAPDMATISISIRGEGATADAASSDLASRQRAIASGLTTLDPHTLIHTGSVATREVRKGDCTSSPGNQLGLLSVDDITAGADADNGPCRVTGYIAAIEATGEMRAVKDAGTAIGLAQRLGASSASLESFSLRDPGPASRAALSAAIADAKVQAQTLAVGSGAKLGRIVSILGMPDRDLTMNQMSASEAPAVAMMVVSAPVEIDVTPKPVETSARIMIVFALVD